MAFCRIWVCGAGFGQVMCAPFVLETGDVQVYESERYAHIIDFWISEIDEPDSSIPLILA